MTKRTLCQLVGTRVALTGILAVGMLTPQAALAQRRSARSGAMVARPVPDRAYPRRAMRVSPIVPAVPHRMAMQPAASYPRQVSPPRPMAQRFPRRTPIRPIFAAPRRSVRSFSAPVEKARAFDRPRIFQQGFTWQGAAEAAYIHSFLFGGPRGPVFESGVRPAYQMLPLGWGLWPACDSASLPGRFWTIAPCAGMGDYPSVTASSAMPEASPYFFTTPLQILTEPPQLPPSKAKQPTAPEEKAKMVVYLTDGRALAVSDWWITGGRFHFITASGATQTVDLPVLDLRKTIEENEQHGRTFILNFTPPNERPVLPSLLSQP